MLPTNCTFKFYLRDSIKSHPKGQSVYCRITYKRKKAEFATGEYCKESNWEPKLGRPIKHSRLKEKIVFIESRLYEIVRELDFNGKTISAKIIRDILKGKHQENDSILLVNYLERYIQRIASKKEDYSEGTVQHYRTTKKHLIAFLKTRKEEDILIKDFGLEHVEELDDWFMTTPTEQFKRPIARNTANKYHTKLKTVLLYAIRKKVISENPYLEFSLKNKPVDRRYLTKEDLDKLTVHKLGDNKSLQLVRDIFLFSCYTGLRSQDAQDLSTEDIIITPDGKYWLRKEQGKTRTELDIPLVQKAIELYHKYDHHREVTGKIIPQFVNQKVNAYLKTIADLVGIKQNLTHHVARHTFATTILLDNGIPIETVQAFLGQKSIKSTMIYAKISRSNKMGAVESLDSKL